MIYEDRPETTLVRQKRKC